MYSAIFLSPSRSLWGVVRRAPMYSARTAPNLCPKVALVGAVRRATCTAPLLQFFLQTPVLPSIPHSFPIKPLEAYEPAHAYLNIKNTGFTRKTEANDR